MDDIGKLVKLKGKVTSLSEDLDKEIAKIT